MTVALPKEVLVSWTVMSHGLTGPYFVQERFNGASHYTQYGPIPTERSAMKVMNELRAAARQVAFRSGLYQTRHRNED